MSGIVTQAGFWGGRKGVLDPLSLDPALWLDAADEGTLFDAVSGGSTPGDGDTVARWEDKSGNDYHGVGSGTFPTRRIAVQNGKDIIRWDARGHFQTTLDYRIDNVDVFIVWEKTGNTANSFTDFGAILGGDALSGAGGRWNITTASTERRVAQVRSNGGAYSNRLATDLPLPSGAEIMWLRGSPAKVGGGRNTTSLEMADHGLTPATTAGSFRIGEGNGSQYDFSIRGDMMEVLIFNAHLNTGDISAVYNYLVAKWGILLT